MPRVFINLHRLKALARQDEMDNGTRVTDFIDEKYLEVGDSRARDRNSWNFSVFYKQLQHDTPNLHRNDVCRMLASISDAMEIYKIRELWLRRRYDLHAAYLEICEGIGPTRVSHCRGNGTFHVIMRCT
jgi:hypothetical protein